MTSSVLRMQHTSLQFSDSREQQEHDIVKLFEKGKDWPIKTGTESGDDKGPNANREFLIKYAREFNHALSLAGDNFVAVDRAIIAPRSVTRGSVFVIGNQALAGSGQDRVMATLRFNHIEPGMGRFAIGGVHYPTQGARPDDPNYRINVLYSKRIAEWLRSSGRGKNISFVNGDFNMHDQRLDFAFGEEFTSIADELEAWKDTGHGPIDGSCSYDKDGRVTAKSFKVLRDKQMHMFTDHFVCRAEWEIKHLKVD